MNRTLTLLLAVACAGSASVGHAQGSVPPDLTATVARAAKAVNARDQKALAPLTQGDPAAIYRWQFRPGGGMAMNNAPWQPGALHAPGGAWLAVFWHVQPCESEGDHVHRLIRTDGQWRIGPEIPEADPLGYHIRDHKIEVAFDPSAHAAHMTDEVQIERTSGAGRAMQMRLSPDFPLDSVAAGGVPIPYTQVGSVIYLVPPPGRQFALQLRYHGAPNHEGTFVGNYITPAEVVLAAYWYPVIARLPATHSDTVTVPSGWTVMAQGGLVSHTEQGRTETWSYRMQVPTTYFTLDAAPYHKYEKVVNGRTYGVYTLVANDQRAIKQVDLFDASFRLFERIWGPYPWDHYVIVETQQPNWPGALEAYSFTTYGQGLLPSTDPHEWGHTWWGGFVPCTYLQDIWNESFATYSEGVYARYADDAPASPEVRNRVLWRRAFPGMDKATSAMPLSETADALYGPASIVGYNKGGLVLQNLEETLGAETLWRCMRAFRDEFYGSYRAATWRDFERTVDRVTGQDYTWWFDQWVRRTGLPKLAWQNVRQTHTADGYVVDADLAQADKPYRLTVPVWLETASGETVKTLQQAFRASTHIHLTCATAATRLLLDPEMRLPRALTSAEVGGGAGARPIVVAGGPDAKKAADRLAQFGLTVKSADAVTDADLKGHDVVLMGDAATNKIWARFADQCPFTVQNGALQFRGKSYPGAMGIAETPSPLDPTHSFDWFANVNPDDSTWGTQAPSGVQITDRAGRLIDGEPSIVRGGPSVYTFSK